eukprot:6516723-Prymnesium_polylepis.1
MRSTDAQGVDPQSSVTWWRVATAHTTHHSPGVVDACQSSWPARWQAGGVTAGLRRVASRGRGPAPRVLLLTLSRGK